MLLWSPIVGSIRSALRGYWVLLLLERGALESLLASSGGLRASRSSIFLEKPVFVEADSV